MQESWPYPQSKATRHGWLTYHTAADGYSYMHSNGTEAEAMTVEFVLVNQQQGTYVMVNLGKPGDDKTKKPKRAAPYPALGACLTGLIFQRLPDKPRSPNGELKHLSLSFSFSICRRLHLVPWGLGLIDSGLGPYGGDAR